MARITKSEANTRLQCAECLQTYTYGMSTSTKQEHIYCSELCRTGKYWDELNRE